MSSAGMSSPMDPHQPMDEPPRPRAWPKAIGIIAIVFGCFGLLCNCLLFFQQKFMEMFADMAAQGGGSQNAQAAEAAEQLRIQTEVMQEYSTVMLVAAFFGVSIAAWLLISGVGMTLRKPWSRGSSMGWAMAKSLLVIGATVLNYLIGQKTFLRMEEAGMGQAASMGQITATVTAVLGLLWGLALPLFLLFFLGRAKIREEVAQWAEAERQMI